MPSRQWTQLNDPDSQPDGIQRIGYDADNAQYTFRHPNGALYQGSEYGGDLTPVRDHIQRVEAERPEVFDDYTRTRPSNVSIPTTFQDILPSSLITVTSCAAAPSVDDAPSRPDKPSPQSRSTAARLMQRLRKGLGGRS
ncbi:hypothetical protein D9611_008639 [Ephemerocybe angulata]|uniref:Uncharacterized protein n=1 Tax=Ephemerocybe angulata TaxID=980116 RepID=A0A8H5AZH7_9AGAR|nr:hypothetical protein D9611_008639 [Tulosesus angulatus]